MTESTSSSGTVGPQGAGLVDARRAAASARPTTDEAAEAAAEAAAERAPSAAAERAPSAADFFAPDAQTRRLGPDRRQRPTRMFSKYWLRGRRRGVRRGTDKQHVYVDRYTKAEWTYVIGIVVMSLADLLLTLNYLERGGEEANPFMRWTIAWGGTAGFASVKMFLTVAGALFLLLHARFRRVRFFMMVLFGGYVALMLYHSFLLSRVGG